MGNEDVMNLNLFNYLCSFFGVKLVPVFIHVFFNVARMCDRHALISSVESSFPHFLYLMSFRAETPNSHEYEAEYCNETDKSF